MKYGIFPDEIIVPFGGDGKGEMVWEIHKVISSIYKRDPTLTNEVSKHLNSIFYEPHIE